MPLNVRPLTPALAEVARKELNEDPARTDQDLTHIKEWLKKQPHINARTDDQWLLTFLRGCKFSLERTKEKLDTYYTLRTILPEFFANRDPMRPEIQAILSLGGHLPLPTLDNDGHRIFLDRIGKVDPSKVKIADSIKVNFMIMDIMLNEDDDSVISGDVGLMDFTGGTLAHMVQMTPAMAKKVTKCFQEGYPARPKGINYIHVNSAFFTVFSLFQILLKEKLRKRLHVHGDDLEALYKNIPQKLLPLEYGGEAGPIDDITAYWKKKVESYRDWFVEEEKFKTDEKKRPGAPKTQENLFGLEGSFRQLNVD